MSENHVHPRMLYIVLVLLMVQLNSRGDETKASNGASSPVTFTTQQDHQNMMNQLGITRLRPGPSGNESAPNHANYDESLANPYPKLPEELTLKNGKPVTSQDAWWKERRPEIVEDMEREVYGRVPKNVPKLAWSVAEAREVIVDKIPVVERQLQGRVERLVEDTLLSFDSQKSVNNELR